MSEDREAVLDDARYVVIGGFEAYIRRPRPTVSGMIAQFFAPNGQDADTVLALGMTRYQDCRVHVTIRLVQDADGRDLAAPTPTAAALKGGALARLAGQFCAQPDFQAFIRAAGGGEQTPRDYILAACGIASRRQLDHDPEAAARFHARVRLPYLDWQRAHSAGADGHDDTDG